MNKDEAGVYFGVFEFGDDLSVVTKIMGIEPTRSWVKGEPISDKLRGVQSHSRWELRSPADPSLPIEEQIITLLPLLEECKDQIREVSEKFEARICCYAYYYQQFNPELHLSEGTIRRLADLRLSIDFDLYFLGRD
jgi:hypothetical protein